MNLSLAHRLKWIIAATIYYSGIIQKIARIRTKDRAFVLMYHRVLQSAANEEVFVQPGMWVSSESFRQQISFLKSKFSILSLAEIVKRLKAKESVGGCCAITFDDGWNDNFRHAFPVLKEINIPATIFLATSFIGTKRLFWPEELTFYLQQADSYNWLMKNPRIISILKEAMATGRKYDFLDRAISIFKELSPSERANLIRGMREKSSGKLAVRQLMTWEEAQEMQSSGLIGFGAHTVSHEILDQMSHRQAEEEIAGSCEEIKDRLGKRPDFFAYPNGNFNDYLKTILSKYGFQAAVTTQKSLVTADTSLLEIPRIAIHEDVSKITSLFFARILLKGF